MVKVAEDGGVRNLMDEGIVYGTLGFNENRLKM